MHRSASPRPGYTTGRSGSLAVGSPRLGARDRALTPLQGDESPALSFLARRGSEAQNNNSDDSDDSFEREVAMANAERDLKADAEWKRIQQNTFTRWANEHLKTVDKVIEDLGTDLSDGLKLIALVEVLSGKKMPRHNKRPNFRSQKLENVSIALEFLEREGITLVNIDSTDIVDCKLKLILGLIWTLILHYAISMPMWDGPPLGGLAPEKTPKQRLMDWVKDKVPGTSNFTSDWNDGKKIGALVDNVAPGLCPDWEDWDPEKPVENAREAMDLANDWLNVPKLLTPEEFVDPNVDEQSMLTYLSQFPNAKLQPGAPLRKKTNAGKVRAYGPGLEPKGLVAKAPANFTVETFAAGDGELAVKVVQASTGKELECEIVCNNDRKATYSCSYFPEEEGDYLVTITWSGREIPKSPYQVNVEGFAGDASKVTAAGPGLEPEGVIINRPTYFDIFAKGAGKGSPEVIILDPKGKKDSVPIRLTPNDQEPETYRCEYVATMVGLHSVNVFFAGNPIPGSPFGVRVSPASIPSKVWASGRGLQPSGIRVNETVDFKVFTEGAGEGKVGVKIIGPGGIDLDYISRAIDATTTEFTYTPKRDGRHIIMITFANVEIPRSPFEVNIGKHKTSKIKAYGPGLKGGIVNKPAKFTVDTCGETGALGFSIQGPSQAKINCKDNGDGSADVEYIPTAEGEYAVHILCDKEDIPGSPYMAQILPATDYDPDKVKVFGPGVESGVNPKEETHFTVDITDAGDAPLEIFLVDDLGQFEPKIKQVSEKVFECRYTPRAKQHKQTVFVNFGGVAVPGSPFRVVNDNLNDPSLVEVYGPGIEPGVRVGVPTEFTVDCSQSGPGDVTVNITSAKRKTVPVSINDNGDNTYTVTYEAQVVGPQTIVINLDDSEVPQSPIKLDIKPAADLSKISLIDFEPEAFVDCPNDFIVDTSALPSNLKAQLDCEISGPDGNPVEAEVSKMGPDGPFQVSYIPTDEGDHEVDLRYDGTPLPDSPYPVTAIHGCNPQKVKAYGDGLEKGIVDEPNTFTIETRNAGTGGLGIAIEGPSEAEMNCTDNKDGTCTVEYVPVEEGDYDIAIKFDDEHIPGSPFQVPVTTKDGKPKADARKVKAYGPGLEPENIFPGKPTSFIVDASATGEAPLEVLIGDGASIGDDNVFDDNENDNGRGGDARKGSRSSGDDLRKGSLSSRKGSSSAAGDGDKDESSSNSRKGSKLGAGADDLASRKGSAIKDDSSRKGSKSKSTPFDEDEDGYGIGNKQGKGLAALRARADSLSGRGSNADDNAQDLGDNNNNGDDLRRSSLLNRGDNNGKKASQDLSSVAGSRKGSEILGGKPSRRNTFSQPVITEKGDGIHEVSYVPPPVGDPYEIAVKYAGVDIPGSPFLMTSNPNIEDVVNAAIADGLGSRKGSALSPERSYSKHGTGLQRGSIAEDGKGGPGDVSDLIRNSVPGMYDDKGRKDSRGGPGGDGGDDDVFPRRGSSADGKYNRSGTDDPSRRKGSGGSLGDSSGSRKSSSGSSGTGSRKHSEETPYGRNLGSRQGSRDLLDQVGRRPSSQEGKRNSGDFDGASGSRKGSRLGSESADRKSSKDGTRGLRQGDPNDDGLSGSRKGSKSADGRKGSRDSNRRSGDFDDDKDGSRKGSKYGSGRPRSGEGLGEGQLDDGTRKSSSGLFGGKKSSSLDNDRKGSKDSSRKGSRGQCGADGDDPSDPFNRRRKGSDDDFKKRSSRDDDDDDITRRGRRGAGEDGDSDDNDPAYRKGSKYGRKSSNDRYDDDDYKRPIDDDDDPTSSRRRGGRGQGDSSDDDDAALRRGSRFGRKGAFDDDDGERSRGDGLDNDDDDDYSRKGSRSRRGLGQSSDSDDDMATIKRRGGSGLPDDDDERRRKRSSEDESSRRNKLGHDPNDPNSRRSGDPRGRKGSADMDQTSRKGSRYDPNDPDARNTSGFDPSGRKGSGSDGRRSGDFDPNDPNARRGSGRDGDEGYDPNDPDARKRSSFDPNDPNGRRGSRLGENDPYGSEGSAYDPNDPNSRKRSGFDPNDPNARKGSGYGSAKDGLGGLNNSNDPNSRKNTAYDPNDPNSRRGSSFDPNGRKGSGYDPNDPNTRKGSNFDPNGRKGSGYDPNDPNSRKGSNFDPNGRKGSGYDPNDPNSRKGSNFDPNGRKGSEYDPNDPLGRKTSEMDGSEPYGRKGSNYDPNDPNGDHSRKGSGLGPLGRKGFNYDPNDPNDPHGRKSSSYDPSSGMGSGFDPSDPNSRKGSNFDTYGKNAADCDPNDPSGRKTSGFDDNDPLGRKASGSYLLDPNSRKGSGLDSADSYGRKGSAFDPSDPNARKESGYDPNDPNSRKGSGYDPNRRKQSGQDPSNPNSRKGSGYGPNDPNGRKGSGYDPNDPNSRNGSGFDPNDTFGRKGSGFGLHDPNGRKGSGYDPNDPNSRKGSGFDPNDPFGRSGSGNDPNDPHSRKGSGYDPNGSHVRKGSGYDPNDPNSRKGSGFDPNDPYGRKGSGNDPNDPHSRKGSGYDPNDPNARKGSGYDPNDLYGKEGSGLDPNGPNSRKGSGYDPNDPHGRKGSGFDPNDPNSRKGSSFNPNDPNGRKGSSGSSGFDPNDPAGYNPNDSYSRKGSGGFDPNYPYGRKGSGFNPDDSSSRKGSGGFDPNDPYGRKGSGFNPDDSNSRKGSGYDPNDPHGRKGSGFDPSNPQSRKGSFYDPNDPHGRKGSGYDPNDPNQRKGSGYEPNDPYGRKGSGFDANDPYGRKGSKYDANDPYGRNLDNESDPNSGLRKSSSLLESESRKGSLFSQNDSRKGSRQGGYDPDSSRKGSSSRRGLDGDNADMSSRKGSSIMQSHKHSIDALDSRKSSRAFGDFDDEHFATGRKESQDARQRKGGRRGPGGLRGSENSSSDDSSDEFGTRRGSRNQSRKGSSDKSRKGSSEINGSRKGSHNDPFNRKGTYTLGKHGQGDSDDLYPFHPVDLNNIPVPSTGGEVTAQVKTPSNAMHLPHIEDNGNGSVGIFYQPTEAGPHKLDVRYNGEHVQGSPFKFFASPNDEGKVFAYGPGLSHAVCGDSANFVISTKGAGAGGLALAVEGPSKADINCIDNKDGTVNVSYLPTAPGEYKISARFSGEHIEGSPFTSKVTGEGKKRNAISVGSASEVSLPENISDYDLRSLNAYIVSPSGCEEPCFLKKLPKGNTGISFTPREVGEHLVSVKRSGKHITNSPFKIMVNPDDVGDASRVKVKGHALKEGKTHEDNMFTVDTKNAGYGGLSLSVEGPSKAEIKCKDNEDGTLDVSYKPSEPGLYIVNLKFADQHVPGSPFAVAVSGQGTEMQTEKINRMREAVPVTEVGSQCRLTFKMPGIKSSDLKASVTAPTGKVEKAIVVELEDGLYAVNFVPYELGVHTVSVMYRDVDIPGSPFQFTVGPLQDGGAHRVHAGGPGLERGVQGQPSDFNVWTREAGHGSLAIAVEGPSKAEVEFKDRKDGSCHVSYVVEEPGEYSVGIRFNDQHIPGSPYKVYILPSADDAERVRMSNVADSPVSLNIPQTMLLNMNGAEGDVECKIVAPSGREDDCFITPLGEGEHTVRFVPKEEGVHHLHARLNGIHIPGSPFKLEVQATNNNVLSDDPSSVGVRGAGIDRGTTGKASKFVIDTSGVGAGTLSITVDGPSKVDLSCNEVDDGYEVSYTPMAPGKYYVTVKYNGKNVRGSPFSVVVNGDNLVSNLNNNRAINLQKEQSRSSMTMETMQRTSYIRHQYSEQRVSSMSVSRSATRNQMLPPSKPEEPDPKKVQAWGKGLEQALISRQNSFSVDCNRAGNNVLYVGVYGPDVPCDEVVIKHQGDKRYSVSYVVHQKGEYIIFVKWGDEHIPGSPFRVVA